MSISLRCLHNLFRVGKAIPTLTVSQTDVVTETVFDGTKIDIQLVDKGLIKAGCTGLVDSIREVVEVLSWLGSALCQSSNPQSISHRLAQVQSSTGKGLDESGPPCLKLEFLEDEDLLAEELSRLAVDEEVRPNDARVFAAKPENGDCWKRVLKNPGVAMGFPVPIRPPGAPGLEISLDAMALLVDAPRLAIFNGRAVLKGHNAAIVLTDASQDSIMRWHFICNENGSRLTFSDPRIRQSFVAEGLLKRIQGARHVLGWTPKVSYNIGTFFFFSVVFPVLMTGSRVAPCRLRYWLVKS
jgi:hypothetical protein